MKFVWRYTVPDTQTGFGAKYWMIPTLPIQKKFLRRTGTILTQSTSSSLLYSRWNLYEDSFQINPHISQIGHCVSYIYCVYMTLYIMCILKKKTCNHQPWCLTFNYELQIGLGDYVPGSGERDGESHHAKLYINYSYLLCECNLFYKTEQNMHWMGWYVTFWLHLFFHSLFYVGAICFIATKHALNGMLYNILTFDLILVFQWVWASLPWTTTY